MTPTQILHAIYLSIIVAIIVLGGAAMMWWHHDAVLQGEAKIKAREQAAAADQHLQDVKASQDVVDELNQDKARLQAELDAKSTAIPPAVIRTCGRLYYVDHPLPAGRGTAATTPSEPPHGAADSGVSGGSGGGDVGQGVRDVALAGRFLAIYDARLYEWAVRTR